MRYEHAKMERPHSRFSVAVLITIFVMVPIAKAYADTTQDPTTTTQDAGPSSATACVNGIVPASPICTHHTPDSETSVAPGEASAANNVASPAADRTKNSDAIARGPIFHPDGPGRFRARLAVGALVDILPTRVVQSEQRQLPRMTANFRVGLPLGFSADAKISAIYISNDFSLGLGWSHRIGMVSFGIQDHQVFTYGYLGTYGFDATGWDLSNIPSASIGLAFPHMRVSLTGELIVTLAQHAKFGDSRQVSNTKTSVAGTALTAVFETMLESGGIIYFGAGVLQTTADYQAWIAFSDQRTRYPYPRFLAGYAF